MSENLYYTEPNLEVFDEIKEKAIKLWSSYDDSFGYATEKINKIKDLENIEDNVMYIVAMFDISNQRLLANVLSSEAKKAIRMRMLAGGASPEYIVF